MDGSSQSESVSTGVLGKTKSTVKAGSWSTAKPPSKRSDNRTLFCQIPHEVPFEEPVKRYSWRVTLTTSLVSLKFGAYWGSAQVLNSPSNPQNCREKEKILEKGAFKTCNQTLVCTKPWFKKRSEELLHRRQIFAISFTRPFAFASDGGASCGEMVVENAKMNSRIFSISSKVFMCFKSKP